MERERNTCQFSQTGFIGGGLVIGEQENWKGKNKGWDWGIFNIDVVYFFNIFSLSDISWSFPPCHYMIHL